MELAIPVETSRGNCVPGEPGPLVAPAETFELGVFGAFKGFFGNATLTVLPTGSPSSTTGSPFATLTDCIESNELFPPLTSAFEVAPSSSGGNGIDGRASFVAKDPGRERSPRPTLDPYFGASAALLWPPCETHHRSLKTNPGSYRRPSDFH
jgi:hypothetical protein